MQAESLPFARVQCLLALLLEVFAQRTARERNPAAIAFIRLRGCTIAAIAALSVYVLLSLLYV